MIYNINLKRVGAIMLIALLLILSFLQFNSSYNKAYADDEQLIWLNMMNDLSGSVWEYQSGVFRYFDVSMIENTSTDRFTRSSGLATITGEWVDHTTLQHVSATGLVKSFVSGVASQGSSNSWHFTYGHGGVFMEIGTSLNSNGNLTYTGPIYAFYPSQQGGLAMYFNDPRYHSSQYAILNQNSNMRIQFVNELGQGDLFNENWFKFLLANFAYVGGGYYNPGDGTASLEINTTKTSPDYNPSFMQHSPNVNPNADFSGSGGGDTPTPPTPPTPTTNYLQGVWEFERDNINPKIWISYRNLSSGASQQITHTIWIYNVNFTMPYSTILMNGYEASTISFSGFRLSKDAITLILADGSSYDLVNFDSFGKPIQSYWDNNKNRVIVVSGGTDLSNAQLYGVLRGDSSGISSLEQGSFRSWAVHKDNSYIPSGDIYNDDSSNSAPDKIISNILNGLKNAVNNLSNIANTFSNFMRTVFSWLPDSVMYVIYPVITLAIILGIVKLLRG